MICIIYKVHRVEQKEMKKKCNQQVENCCCIQIKVDGSRRYESSMMLMIKEKKYGRKKGVDNIPMMMMMNTFVGKGKNMRTFNRFDLALTLK